MRNSEGKIAIAHILFRFATGGLENGVVNLVNNLPEDRYQHYLVCLLDFDREFAQRITASNVELFALEKQPGHDLGLYRRLYRLLAELKPGVVHSRNFGALESQIIARLLNVPSRIHGEHGWDVDDLTGGRIRSRLVRKTVGLAVDRFVTVSDHLREYLITTAHIPAGKVTNIYNGVDTVRFAPFREQKSDPIVIGTVGRMQSVKNQSFLVEAFIAMLQSEPGLCSKVRLKLVGDGPLLKDCRAMLADAGLLGNADLVGASNDVANELRTMNLFVLPSLAEGISNTVLEAMATGLPVIATRVGGNSELVVPGETGELVELNDVAALVDAMKHYIGKAEVRSDHGMAARRRVESHFSLERMIDNYDRLYSGPFESSRKLA